MHYWNTELLTARFRTRAGWTAVAAVDRSRGSDEKQICSPIP